MAIRESFATVIHDVVEESTNSIEEIHKTLAGLPIDILENVPGLERPLEEVRKTQNRAIETVYSAVRDVNEELTRLAMELAQPKRRSAKKRSKSTRVKAHSRSADTLPRQPHAQAQATSTAH